MSRPALWLAVRPQWPPSLAAPHHATCTQAKQPYSHLTQSHHLYQGLWPPILPPQRQVTFKYNHASDSPVIPIRQDTRPGPSIPLYHTLVCCSMRIGSLLVQLQLGILTPPLCFVSSQPRSQ